MTDAPIPPGDDQQEQVSPPDKWDQELKELYASQVTPDRQAEFVALLGEPSATGQFTCPLCVYEAINALQPHEGKYTPGDRLADYAKVKAQAGYTLILQTINNAFRLQCSVHDEMSLFSYFLTMEKKDHHSLLPAWRRSLDIAREERKRTRKPKGKTATEAPAEKLKPVPTGPMPDLATLLKEIEHFIRTYVVLDSDQASTMALWVLHTWAIDAADSTLYLRVTSPQPRCGKSTLLRVCAEVVFNPWRTDRVSAAALYRKIHADHPTLLLDETDAAFKSGEEYSEALRGILNSGHTRDGTVTVCISHGDDIQTFSTFCPKTFAGLTKLANTLMDRSVQIVMRRKVKGEQVARARHRELKEAAKPLVEQLTNWYLQADTKALRYARPALPEELDDRAQDGWEPLLAIADAAGGEWPERARKAALHLSAGMNRIVDEDNVGVNLLRDLRTIFEQYKDAYGKPRDRFTTDFLLLILNQNDESPWGGWHQGKGLTARDLAKILSAFEVDPVNRPGVKIGPRQIWFNDKKERGYLAGEFQDAFARYLALDSKPSCCSPSDPVGAVEPATDKVIRELSDPVGIPLIPGAKNAENPRQTPILPDLPDKNP